MVSASDFRQPGKFLHLGMGLPGRKKERISLPSLPAHLLATTDPKRRPAVAKFLDASAAVPAKPRQAQSAGFVVDNEANAAVVVANAATAAPPARRPARLRGC